MNVDPSLNLLSPPYLALANAVAGSSQLPGTAADKSATPAGNQMQDVTSHDDDANDGKKKKGAKRRKVNHACLYCRRSHMTCDEGRPCQRCIKREIGHLCHDEPQKPAASKAAQEKKDAPQPQQVLDKAAAEALKNLSAPVNPFFVQPQAATTAGWPLVAPPGVIYPSETLGSEFSVLTDFLESLDDRAFFNGPQAMQPSSGPGPTQPRLDPQSVLGVANADSAATAPQQQLEPHTEHVEVLPAATKTERFFLTAADQESGTRDERLAKVIHSKYEAGLLKPYNYVKGYARLSRWMDRNVSPDSRQQILQPLSVLRPKFRAIAQSLTDIDLVFIEEAFERLLLDYDRVFSAMGIPACLWRRTGEIYKGNREFAHLVGVDVRELTDGRLCIYELMSEESAVNYWEKYGHVAFDTGQKAVLTSCVLRFKPVGTSSGSATGSNQGTPVLLKNARKQREQQQQQQQKEREETFIHCCFSFTIRRDAWGIPAAIIGNFIQY